MITMFVAHSALIWYNIKLINAKESNFKKYESCLNKVMHVNKEG